MIDITKKEIITIKDSNGKEIHLGDVVIFDALGKCFTGSFAGFNRNALKFNSVISGAKVTFNVLPKTIEKIYLAESEE